MMLCTEDIMHATRLHFAAIFLVDKDERELYPCKHQLSYLCTVACCLCVLR